MFCSIFYHLYPSYMYIYIYSVLQLSWDSCIDQDLILIFISLLSFCSIFLPFIPSYMYISVCYNWLYNVEDQDLFLIFINNYYLIFINSCYLIFINNKFYLIFILIFNHFYPQCVTIGARPYTFVDPAWSRDSLITGIPVVGEHLWVQIFKKEEQGSVVEAKCPLTLTSIVFW